MYVYLVFQAVFIGFSVGSAPVVSYNFGSGNYSELKSLLKKSLIIIAASSVIMFAVAEISARPLSLLFVGYDKELLSMTQRAFFIYSFAFLFSGFSVFGSSFFTALNDGLVSAFISFMRTLVFQVVSVLTLPLLLDLDGIWLSIVAAEVLAIMLTALMLIVKKKKYNY